MDRVTVRVLISMGSNVDKERNLPAALAQLEQEETIDILAVSDIYRTPAVGKDGKASDQDAFHNAAAAIETSLAPAQLRQTLRDIEQHLGRVRTIDKFAPRTIDLDIALYGDAVLDLEGSLIPDPDIVRFPHVAVPLANVAPDWIHPQTGTTLRQIAQRLAQNELKEVTA